jgi:GYF domain 2
MSDQRDAAQPKWLMSRGGKQFGPFSAPVLSEMAQLGTLRADDLLWKPGDVEWKPASTMSGLWKPPALPEKREPQSELEKAKGTYKGILVAIGVGLAIFAVKSAQGWLPDNDPGLRGTIRSSFIQSVIETCVKTANKEIAKELNEYCTCYANSVADKLSNNDAKQAAREKSIEPFQPIMQAAVEVCLKEAVASER